MKRKIEVERRKLNPREWWPQWLLTDAITFERDGIISLHKDNGIIGYWSDTSVVLDLSWIPEHLKRSGTTIKNPWKGGE